MPPVVDPVQAGREALARHAWQEAFDQLSQADRDGKLSGSDLEALASAAFFVARAGDELALKERAFKAYETEGDEERAAFLALDVARDYGYAGKPSIASAWTRRAERIVGADGDTYAHGYLALVRSEAAGAAGDIETALPRPNGPSRSATRAANADLKAFAQTNLGALKIASGQTTDGFALMEEASIAAVNGELSPFTTGVTACRMISACRDLTDYRRASEWIEATERYCDRQSLIGFPGRVPDPPRRGGRGRRRVGAGRSRNSSRRRPSWGAYNATPAAGRRVLRDRRHPPPARRLRGRRGRAPRSARARSIAAACARAHPPGRGQGQGRVRPRSTRPWPRRRGTAGPGPGSCRRRWRSRSRPATSARGPDGHRRARRRSSTGYPSPALEAGRQVALGRVLVAEGDPAAAAHGSGRRSAAGARSAHRTRSRGRARSCHARCERSMTRTTPTWSCDAALDEFRRLGARIDVEAAERELRDAEDRRTGPVDDAQDVHVHRHRRLDDPRGGARRPRVGAAAALARRHAPKPGRERGRGDRQLDRRWVLRGLRLGARPRSSARSRSSAPCVEHRETTGFALVGADRAAHGRGQPARDRLQRQGRPCRRASRRPWRLAARSSRRPRPSPKPGDVPASEPRETSIRGVGEPVQVATVAWG